MPLRLLLGLVKGLVLGGLIGYGLAVAGFGLLPGWLAYAAAPVAGILVALVAGKPIWAKGAHIEVGAKAVAGALIAPLLMLASRSFLTMELPLDPGVLPGVVSSQGATLGTFALSSLALVAALLGGFFDADHEPGDDDEQDKPSAKRRVAAVSDDSEREAEPEAEASDAAEPRRHRA